MWAIASVVIGPLRLAAAPIWLLIKGLLTTNGFLAALLIAGGALAFTYDQSRVKSGRIQEAAERTKRNDHAVELANRGASGAGGKRVLDPYAASE